MLLSSALEIAESIQNQEAKALALAYVGAKYIELAQTETANQIFIQSLSIAQYLHEESLPNQEIYQVPSSLRILEIFADGYSKLEQYEAALPVIQTITNLDFQQQALSDLAKLAIRSQEYETALKLTNLLVDSGQKIVSLGSLALVYLQTKQIDKANDLLSQILTLVTNLSTDSDTDAILILRDLAIEYGNNQYFDEALQISQSIPIIYDRAKFLISLANLYADLEDHAKVHNLLDMALKLAKNILTPTDKTNIVHELMAVYIKLGELSEAIDLLHAIEPTWQIPLLLTLASNYISNAEYADAEPIIDEILAILNNFYTTPEQQEFLSYYLEQIAIIYLAAGEYQKAESLVQVVADRASQIRLLTMVANAYAKNGFYNQAISLMKKFPPSEKTEEEIFLRDVLLSNISQEAAQSKQFDTALKIAHRISDIDRQGWALVTMVKSYLDDNQIYEAIKVTQSMPLKNSYALEDKSYQTEAWHSIILNLGENNQLDIALDLTQNIQDIEQRMIVLEDLADIYIIRKDYEKAQEIAELLLPPHPEKIYGKIAVIYAEKGQPEMALKMLEKVETNQYGKAGVLGAIAVSYNKLGNKEKAIELIEQAISINPPIDDVSDINWLLTNIIAPALKVGQGGNIKQIFQQIFHFISQMPNDHDKVNAISEILNRFDKLYFD